MTERAQRREEVALLELSGATIEGDATGATMPPVVERCPDCDGTGVTGNSPDSPPCGTCEPFLRSSWDNEQGNPFDGHLHDLTRQEDRRPKSHRTGASLAAPDGIDGLADEGGPSDEWMARSRKHEAPGFYDDEPGHDRRAQEIADQAADGPFQTTREHDPEDALDHRRAGYERQGEARGKESAEHLFGAPTGPMVHRKRTRADQRVEANALRLGLVS